MVRKPELLSFLLIVGLCAGASAELISYHPFNEGSGTTAADVTGNGNDGTFNGNVEWVAGLKGTAVRFDTAGERIVIGPLDPTAANNAMTLAAWINWEGQGHSISQQGIIGKRLGWDPGTTIKWFWQTNPAGDLLFRADSAGGGTGLWWGNGLLTSYQNEWIHVALTWDNGAAVQYINGEEVSTGNVTFRDTADATPVTIGCVDSTNNETFVGIIDEARIYDTALTPAQIAQAMKGDTGSASSPQPPTEATDVPREVVLSWMPGEFAAPANGHIVYLSDSFSDVNDGIGGATVSESSYAPPQRLDLETTYYWRVDEVNAPPDSTVHQGEIWTFATEPVAYPVDGANITATASSVGQAGVGPENTINGSGLDDNDLHSTTATDMWLSGDEPLGGWLQYEFDNVYKLHEMWVWNSNQVFEPLFGFGLKDVTVEYSTNGIDWTALAGVPQFTKAPGKPGYAHDTTVDFGGAAARFVKLTATSNWGGVLPQYSLSEVRFFSIPVIAREPSPGSGAADVDPAVTLTWRVGREAGKHDVYLSTDEQPVIDGTAPAVSVADASYSSDLDLAGTYYWRIDEVNDTETPTIWQSEVWSFSTSESLVVDDFESYNNIDPPDPASNRIFESWSDGFGVATNGALVGNDLPPYLEQTIVHGGGQSMPLFYSNTGGAVSSETTRTFAPGRDWTKHGIQTLVLHFQGIPGNTGQLYVKVNGVKVPYPGDAGDLTRLLWTQWSVDLASLGVNLTSVTSLTIGIDGSSAAGTLYVDDILLYRLAPPVPAEQIWLEAEAAAPLGASWRVYTDPASSAGSHIGSEDGDGDDNDTAPGAAWVATYSFDASGGTYKVLLRAQEQGSDSFWVRIPTATAQSHEDPDQPGSGWVRFNEIDAPNGWTWDEVHSNDHSNAVVNWTLPAGANTIEIAKREDGVWLDAIVISKID